MLQTPVKPRLCVPRQVEIIDTQRELLQSPWWHYTGKMSPSIEERVDLFRDTVSYGVKFFEFFSPVVGRKEDESLSEIIKARDEIYRQTGNYVYILVHSRVAPQDVESAMRYSSGINGFNFFMGTSEQSQKYTHGKELDEIPRRAIPLLQDLRRNHPDLMLRFSGEDAFRTPIEDLFRVYDPIADLVDRFGLPDTVGVATPKQVADVVSAVASRYIRKQIGVHLQDDRKLAIANALAAVDAKSRFDDKSIFVDTTILGFGERSGIVSMTALVLNLFETDESLVNGYNKILSYPINMRLANTIGTQVPSDEPVSLTNRTHNAGPHANAVLINNTAYEAHRLEEFGVTDYDILLGPLSGKGTVEYFLREVFYYDGVTPEIAERVARRLKEEAGKPYQDLMKLTRDIAEGEFGLGTSKHPGYFENLLNGRR